MESSLELFVRHLLETLPTSSFEQRQLRDAVLTAYELTKADLDEVADHEAADFGSSRNPYGQD